MSAQTRDDEGRVISRSIKYRVYVKSENKVFGVETITWVATGLKSVRIIGLITPAWVKRSGRNQQAYGSKTNIVMADNLELMQWTGLRDKYAAEIYEGDVLDYMGYRSVVSLYPGRFVGEPISPRSMPTPVYLASLSRSQLIRLGNRYVNPELLN